MSPATPPTPLESMVAALVAERGQVIACEVIVELAARFGLEIPDAGDLERAHGISESWETCATEARREGAALRRQVSVDASEIETMRVERRLLDRLAAGFQAERDEARANGAVLFAIGWEAVCAFHDAEASAAEAHDRIEDLRRDLASSKLVCDMMTDDLSALRSNADAEAARLTRLLASEKFRADAAVEKLEAEHVSASRSVEAGLEWRARAEAAERALAAAKNELVAMEASKGRAVADSSERWRALRAKVADLKAAAVASPVSPVGAVEPDAPAVVVAALPPIVEPSGSTPFVEAVESLSGFALVQRARAAKLGMPVATRAVAIPTPRRADPVTTPRAPMRSISSPPEPIRFTAPPAAFMSSPGEPLDAAPVLGTPHVEPRYRSASVRLVTRMPPAPSETCGSPSSSTATSRSGPGIASPAPVHLRVLQVEQLAGPDDSFHCPPFVSTVRAGTCLDRQRLVAVEQTAGSSRAARETRQNRKLYARCRGCILGISVEARLADVGESASAAE